MHDKGAHRAEMAALVAQRLKAGLPSWRWTIDLSDTFHNETLTFEERRDLIVSTIRNHPWAKEGSSNLEEILDNLAEVEDTTEFDGWWSELYDRADVDRVWIKTR